MVEEQKWKDVSGNIVIYNKLMAIRKAKHVTQERQKISSSKAILKQ